MLDATIPAEERDAEIKDILARELIKQANDPSSGIMDEVIRLSSGVMHGENAGSPSRSREMISWVSAMGHGVDRIGGLRSGVRARARS